MKLALCAGSFAADIESGRITIYDLLEVAEKYKFEALEIREDLLQNKQEDLMKIRQLSAVKGLHLIYAWKLWPLNTDLESMKEIAALVKQGIDDTVTIGAELFKIGFGPVGNLEELTEVHIDIVKDFAAYAEKRKVVICLENADKDLGGSAETIKELLIKVNSENLKTTYDCGNYAIRGDDPVKALKTLGSLIGYVHLKDVKTRETKPTWLGNGNIDFDGVFGGLKDIAFDGYNCFEFIMCMDRLCEIEESLKFCQPWIKVDLQRI